MVILDAPPTAPLQRPLHIKRKGAYDGSFIRSGDGDRRLTAYEVTQLLSTGANPATTNQRWLAQPLPTAIP